MTTKLDANPEAVVRIRLDQPRIRRVLARTPVVPGFGWARFSPAALTAPASAGDRATSRSPTAS